MEEKRQDGLSSILRKMRKNDRFVYFRSRLFSDLSRWRLERGGTDMILKKRKSPTSTSAPAKDFILSYLILSPAPSSATSDCPLNPTFGLLVGNDKRTAKQKKRHKNEGNGSQNSVAPSLGMLYFAISMQ
jgi:hypothetical protein